MNRVRSFLNRLKSLGLRLRGRRFSHREVSIIGPDRKGIERLVGSILSATRTGASSLASDDPLAAKLRSFETGQVDSAWQTFAALYTEVGRRVRSRRWRFHLPAIWEPEPENLEYAWKTRTDVILIDWPLARMEHSANEALDDLFRINGCLAAARDRGRLLRAAIVVSDLPAHIAPQDASQVVMRLRPTESLQGGLSRLLVEGKQRCGHPLADPEWREFVSKRLLTSRSLQKLYENTRSSLGREVPIFFLAQSPRNGEYTNRLLEWLHTPRTPGYSRRARILTTAALLCLPLIAAAMVVHAAIDDAMRPTDIKLVSRAQGVVLGDSRSPAVLDTLATALADRAARYLHRIPAWLSHPFEPTIEATRLLALSGGVKDLADGLRVAADSESLRLRFKVWLAETDSIAHGSLPPLVGSDGAIVNNLLEERCRLLERIVEEREQWYRLLEDAAIPDAAFVSIDKMIANLVKRSVLSALSLSISMNHQPDRVYLPPMVGAAIAAAMDDSSVSLAGVSISRLVDGMPLEEFVRECLEGGAIDGDTVSPISFVVEVDSIIKAIKDQPLSEIARHRDSFKDRLDVVISLEGRLYGEATLVTTAEAMAARRLLTAINQALRSRPMTITVSASVVGWHWHVATQREGPYAAFQLVSERAVRCEINLDAKPCGRLYYKHCGNSGRASVRDGVSCDEGRAIHQILLDTKSKLVTVDGRDFRVEVTEGWPEWPPNS